ncbi:hypothetical protein K469DRAFT_695047 [Zopfia rhizophila CBS 207.26]|uniref:Uncharacterized protein n=1 Tax=Zopfia rhizophila CBS 207.26 TaxID=1314779 RepID=A0A6A6DMH7_9PEZI|nr:hypothetical protein K469DRAFT_695047 [Zopfia rhizophila CBS 207.26]
MSDSEATVEDPTLYQDMGTSLPAKPDSSNEAVATTEQLAPERKSYLGSGEVNVEVKGTKHSPREMKKPSPYDPLGAMERMSALVTQLSCKLAQQDTRISTCEKNDRYTMSHLGEIDDQLNSLGSDLEETKDIIQRVQKEIRSVKRGRDGTDEEDEWGKAENAATAPKRKRARFA